MILHTSSKFGSSTACTALSSGLVRPLAENAKKSLNPHGGGADNIAKIRQHPGTQTWGAGGQPRELETGLEPVTHALQERCATNCATPAVLAMVPEHRKIPNSPGLRGVVQEG